MKLNTKSQHHIYKAADNIISTATNSYTISIAGYTVALIQAS